MGLRDRPDLLDQQGRPDLLDQLGLLRDPRNSVLP
jgi:hypothetical protein